MTKRKKSKPFTTEHFHSTRVAKAQGRAAKAAIQAILRKMCEELPNFNEDDMAPFHYSVELAGAEFLLHALSQARVVVLMQLREGGLPTESVMIAAKRADGNYNDLLQKSLAEFDSKHETKH